MSRAIGETAAVMFSAGYAASIATSLLQSAASMSNMIFLYCNVGSQWPSVGEKVYSAAFVLSIVVLLLNGIARLVSYRTSRMMKH
jgi:phosphate transport system permease protein